MTKLGELQNELKRLRSAVQLGQQALLTAWKPFLLKSAYAPDASNLAAYIALRRENLTKLQSTLSGLGLSSLGRCEGHVEATLSAVAQAVDALAGQCTPQASPQRSGKTNHRFNNRLQTNTERLLGKAPQHRQARIMVTLPTVAASDARFVRDLVDHGMDIARINCAHDDATIWKAMIDNVRAAAKAAKRNCLIHMDLAGPKLRTGDMLATQGVLRLKPKRDDHGDTRAPAYFLFDASGESGGPGLRGASGLAGYARVSVSREWLARLQPGDVVEATDMRAKKRMLNVLERMGEAHMLACAADSVWLGEGVALKRLAGESRQRACKVGAFEPTPEVLLVHVDDRILLSRDAAPGQTLSGEGLESCIGRIPCAQPEVLDSLSVGERVFIDDGQIGAEVERLTTEGAVLRITRARPEGDKIRPGKGLNFPDSDLQLPALVDKDLIDLDFVAREADIVGYSFVQSAADMDRLSDELEARGAGGLGRIAKIETAGHLNGKAIPASAIRPDTACEILLTPDSLPSGVQL